MTDDPRPTEPALPTREEARREAQWVLMHIMNDPSQLPSDRVAAAAAILRSTEPRLMHYVGPPADGGPR